MGWRALFTAIVVVTIGCSGEGEPADASPDDAALDHVGQDVQVEDVADAAVETFGVPLCTEIGVEKVLPYDIAIANDFAMSVLGDCRVIQLLLGMTQPEASSWLERTSTWVGAFFGCPGSAGHVTSFGPVDTGKSPVIAQPDIDVLVELFALATEKSIVLTPAQSAALRSELARVGATAVNLPISEHALSLCTDGGPSDAGADVAADAEIDAPQSDAAGDAGAD